MNQHPSKYSKVIKHFMRDRSFTKENRNCSWYWSLTKNYFFCNRKKTDTSPIINIFLRLFRQRISMSCHFLYILIISQKYDGKSNILLIFIESRHNSLLSLLTSHITFYFFNSSHYDKIGHKNYFFPIHWRYKSVNASTSLWRTSASFAR